MSFKRFAGRSFAVLFVAGAIASVSANARMLHKTSSASPASDTRITVHVYNRGQMFEDVKIDGHVYTLNSQEWLSIKAPAGTPVYAESTRFGHHKGDLLFAVSPKADNTTVTLY